MLLHKSLLSKYSDSLFFFCINRGVLCVLCAFVQIDFLVEQKPTSESLDLVVEFDSINPPILRSLIH